MLFEVPSAHVAEKGQVVLNLGKCVVSAIATLQCPADVDGASILFHERGIPRLVKRVAMVFLA